jgi:phage protein U
LLSKAREVEHDRQRFAASLKGINLDSQNKESQEEAYERVKRRAKARLTGMSEEEVELSEIGINLIVEE